MIRFSVIIPNLNSPTIGLTIRSLENQGYPAEQIIVVGMDKFGLVHESDLIHFDRSDVPLSPARARNRGSRQAYGEVLVFIDADCIAQPDWLLILSRRFMDPGVSVVGGGVDFLSTNYWTLSDNISMFHEFLNLTPSGERNQLPSLNLAIRRPVFELIGGFDEHYPRPSSEDADLTIRLRRDGYRLYFDPKAIVAHRPPRNRLRDLVFHGYYQGKYSTKVDPRYGGQEALHGLLRTRIGLIGCSMLLAAAVTIRIFIHVPALLKFWYTAPAIFLEKMAWCFGAANHPPISFWKTKISSLP
jgi:cellulose synthase/poly-beta-1,6-N-acetylglucosamine synthase-like glycosyltransferase